MNDPEGKPESVPWKFLSLSDFKDSRVFFEMRLPAVYGWFILALVMIFAGGFAWVWFGELDVIVKAQAVLRPKQNVSVLKNAVAGSVAEKLFLQGEKVDKGQALWRIDTSAVAVDSANTALQLSRTQARLWDVELLEASYSAGYDTIPSGRREAANRAGVYFNEINRLTLAVEKARQNWQKETDLPVSLSVAQRVQELETEYRLAELSLEGYKGEERLKLQEEKNTLLTEKENLQRRLAALERQEKDALVLAPLAGSVEEIRKINAGDYLVAGEEVARVVPEEARDLKAELSVDNKDIAEIKAGMRYLIKFEALSPSEYGQLEGTIQQVGADARLLPNAPPFFVLEGDLEKTYLVNRKGERVNLKSGMVGEARIILKRRQILRFLLEKLDFLL